MGVSKWFDKFQALNDVSLEIRHGIITSLIGPSGCGKTTLLRCFNRVNERYGNVRTTGTIELLGKNIYDADVSLIELRKSIGMVFQRPNPLPISVYENVIFGLRIHSEKGRLSHAESDLLQKVPADLHPMLMLQGMVPLLTLPEEDSLGFSAGTGVAG